MFLPFIIAVVCSACGRRFFRGGPEVVHTAEFEPGALVWLSNDRPASMIIVPPNIEGLFEEEMKEDFEYHH